MELDEINYKTLRRIQQQEKSSPIISKIDINYYQKLTEFLRTFDSLVKKEENPQKIKLFKDEILKTRSIANNIYELREKKIVQSALSKVRGGKPDLNNMLDIEKKLYNSVIEQIILSRKEILEEKSEEKDEIKQEKKEVTTNKNPIVRVVKDIPEFVGTDMKTYSLRKEDVLALSKEMSDPLLKRGVIKLIK